MTRMVRVLHEAVMHEHAVHERLMHNKAHDSLLAWRTEAVVASRTWNREHELHDAFVDLKLMLADSAARD